MNSETRRSLAELRDAAIKIITEAARLRPTEDGGPDMADFVAHVVSAGAANVGGPELFLAGRLESWEANLVRELINGTIGYDPGRWQTYRTEPIKMTLNVAELIETHDLHPGLLGLQDAVDKACARVWVGLDDNDCADARVDEAKGALELRYSTEYRLYAERFRHTVRTLADEMGLPAIEFELDADPGSPWWDETVAHNPDPWGDPVIDDLWQRAHDIARLPNVDAAHGDGAAAIRSAEGGRHV